jgi:hypothetical protein
LVPSNIVALQLEATDANGDTLTYGAVGLPNGLSIDPATGRITGTFTPASVGTHSVTVSVSDGAVTTSQSFLWVVANQ